MGWFRILSPTKRSIPLIPLRPLGDIAVKASTFPSTSNSVANMDNKEISELTKAVIKVAEMGEGLSNFAKGKVQEEIRKEVNEILSKAVNK